MHRRALLAAVVLATGTAHAQAVLGPAEDATVAPVGAARFKFANSWQHFTGSASDSAYEAIGYSQLRYTTLWMELGVMRGISATLIAPEVGNLITTSWYSHQGDTLRLDSVVNRSHNGLGDLEIGAKWAFLRGPGEAERIALPGGVRVRSAVSAYYRFATGTPPTPDDLFGVATGSGRTAITAAWQGDLMIGRAFWITAAAHYQWPSTITRDVMVRGDSVTPLGTVTATQSAGNVWSFEATPRVVLGRYFALGAQYSYLRREASHFTGTRDTTIGGNPVTLDASSLDSLSQGTGQFLSGTFTYSTVAAYLQGKAGFPIEISYQYAGTLSATGVIPRQLATNTVTIRLWARLFGADFTKGMAVPPSAR